MKKTLTPEQIAMIRSPTFQGAFHTLLANMLFGLVDAARTGEDKQEAVVFLPMHNEMAPTCETHNPELPYVGVFLCVGEAACVHYLRSVETHPYKLPPEDEKPEDEPLPN